MKTTNLIRGLVLLCCLLLVAPAQAATPDLALPGDSVYQLPVVLIDQDGSGFDWRSRRGEPQLVTMFYTACPYMCPLIIDAGKSIEKALTPEQLGHMRLLFISMDPTNDTPAALMALAKQRKLDTARWTLASPQEQAVASVAGVLGVRYRKLADGNFNHTGELILLDREGRIVTRTEKIGSKADPEFLAAIQQAIKVSVTATSTKPPENPQ